MSAIDITKPSYPNPSVASIRSNFAIAASEIDAKQDLLVSATNIKTINGSSILGSGNLTVSGSGDMVLASVQTNSGVKTFLDGTLALRNVANTFSALVTNTNTAARTYTFKDANGTVAFTSDITGTNSGTNTGDQTITLTGDVTGTGTGSFAATIATGAVTLAKQANMATASLVYRKTAGAGAPEIQTLTTLKTDLGLTGTNSGDQTITLTGEATGSGTGSFAVTLTNANVIGKVITGYVSGSGTVAATDTILQAIQKLNGNDATNANLTGPITSSGNATSVAAQTGTGSTFVMQASPTLTTPVLGVATVTSLNKVSFTSPATGSTLTIADGKTLTASNTLTLAGTDSTTMTFPPASASVGYLNIPQNAQSTAYTMVLADAGKNIHHPAADTTARTWTMPANASVAFPIGTIMVWTNEGSAGVITASITSDTMVWVPAGTTGNRTIAANGFLVWHKITSTKWNVWGQGVT